MTHKNGSEEKHQQNLFLDQKLEYLPSSILTKAKKNSFQAEQGHGSTACNFHFDNEPSEQTKLYESKRSSSFRKSAKHYGYPIPNGLIRKEGRV